jgi:anti-sigma B factor antagonist
MTNCVLTLPSELKMQRHADSLGVLLALHGELDLGSAAAFEHELRETRQTQTKQIVLDLRGLDFMDCTGISLLIRAQQATQADGHQFAIRCGEGQVRRLFQLTELLGHFTFLDPPPSTSTTHPAWIKAAS